MERRVHAGQVAPVEGVHVGVDGPQRLALGPIGRQDVVGMLPHLLLPSFETYSDFG
jgi:hypothetical protein